MNHGITLLRMILREMQQSKLNTLFCLLTVAVAVSVLVALLSITQDSVDATRRMMKDMGFNLLITAKGVDPARYQALDFDGPDLPEDYVDKLVKDAKLAQHIVGKYQKCVQVNGCTIVLTGILAEKTEAGGMKPMPTAYDVADDTVLVGSAAASALRVEAGAKLTLLGKEFAVKRVLTETGMIPEDIRVFAPLHQVQELVGKAGRVNAIDALACQCPVSAKDIVAYLAKGIQAVIPDVEVHPYQSILLARHQQRVLVDRIALAALSVVMMASAAAIWGLTHQNVRNRRREIGVLRALGVADGRVALLFLGKIAIYSVAGAVAGLKAGQGLARVLRVTEQNLPAPDNLLLMLLIGTPVAAMVFALPAIVGGLLTEPAEALGDREA